MNYEKIGGYVHVRIFIIEPNDFNIHTQLLHFGVGLDQGI